MCSCKYSLELKQCCTWNGCRQYPHCPNRALELGDTVPNELGDNNAEFTVAPSAMEDFELKDAVEKRDEEVEYVDGSEPNNPRAFEG